MVRFKLFFKVREIRFMKSYSTYIKINTFLQFENINKIENN